MLEITNLQELPHVSGVYKIINSQGQVVYIGQAKNINKRWKKGHHKLGEIIAKYGLNVYIEWVVVPEWLLNRVENTAISFYQPEFNSKKPPIV